MLHAGRVFKTHCWKYKNASSLDDINGHWSILGVTAFILGVQDIEVICPNFPLPTHLHFHALKKSMALILNICSEEYIYYSYANNIKIIYTTPCAADLKVTPVLYTYITYYNISKRIKKSILLVLVRDNMPLYTFCNNITSWKWSY